MTHIRICILQNLRAEVHCKLASQTLSGQALIQKWWEVLQDRQTDRLQLITRVSQMLPSLLLNCPTHTLAQFTEVKELTLGVNL